MTTKTLDQWDCQLIYLFKSGDPTIDELKALWAERCNIKQKYINLRDIAFHLLGIVYSVGFSGPFEFYEFVKNLDNNQQWKFTSRNKADNSIPSISLEDTSLQNWGLDCSNQHLLNIIRVCGSFLALRYIKDLPGYSDFLLKIKNEKNE